MVVAMAIERAVVKVLVMVIAKYHNDYSNGNGNGNNNGIEYYEAMQNIIIMGTMVMAWVMSLKKVVEEDSEGKLGWYWTMEVT